MIEKLDCRVFSFSKWILPKTDSLYSTNSNAITIGYFDFVEVRKVSHDSNNTNPLHIYIQEKSENSLNNYITNESSSVNALTNQDVFAFTNIGIEDKSEFCYDKDKIEAFWKEESLVQYYSFLHIENGDNKATIDDLFSRINDLFNNDENKYNAVCYFSFDYSDVIICTHNIAIKDFTNNIYSLNYGNKQKIVRDSFSLIGINNSLLRIISTTLDSKETFDFEESKKIISNCLTSYNCSSLFEQSFSVSFNVGIQNMNVFYEFINSLPKDLKHEKFESLGRHDATIYCENVDLYWLIMLQYYLDKYSLTDDDDSDDDSLSWKDILYNCEAYIRIPFNNELLFEDEPIGSKPNEEFEVYKNAKDIMDTKIKEYNRPDIELNNEHIIPIYTLKQSILGLLKNGFADDFVLCIFESFINFLDYMKNKVDDNYKYETKFDECFNNYFDNVNSLINSAMHSERQFIQSPSFSPVFYDIPPKLMAYYTAMTNIIVNLIKTNEGDKHYSFMFRPSFDRDINLKKYSYDEKAPSDRLLVVKINEYALYYPFNVICQMCHEIAHYVGDQNRNREARSESFVKSLLYILFYEFSVDFYSLDYINTYNSKLGNKLDKEFTSLLTRTIKNLFEKINEQDFYKDDYKYFENFQRLFNNTKQYILTNESSQKIIKEFFSSFDSKQSVYYNSENANREFIKYLDYKVQGYIFETDLEICESIGSLRNVYSEIYADLQMIMVLDLNLGQYWALFEEYTKNNDKISIKSISKVYYRILNIVMFFTIIDKWDVSQNEEYQNVLNIFYDDIELYIAGFNKEDFIVQYSNFSYKNYDILIKKYNNSESDIKISDLKKYINSNIQKYLIAAYNSSKNTYADKDKRKYQAKIKDRIKVLSDFSNAAEVFTTVQEVNDEYKMFLKLK